MSSVIKCDVCGNIVDTDANPTAMIFTVSVSGLDEEGRLARLDAGGGSGSEAECCSRSCAINAIMQPPT